MSKPKPRRGARMNVRPRVTVTVGRCEMFSTMGMVCPLCQKPVPPNTRHVCTKEA